MTLFQYFHSRISRSVSLLAATGALLALSACASFFDQTPSPLPVEARQSGGGRITAAHAYEHSGRLYVSGSADTSPLSASGHVDIQLVDANGQIVAEKRDTIRSSRPRPGGGKLSTDSFIASFPLAEARQAVKVRVVYHGGSHS
jgi:hypothetical protein